MGTATTGLSAVLQGGFRVSMVLKVTHLQTLTLLSSSKFCFSMKGVVYHFKVLTSDWKPLSRVFTRVFTTFSDGQLVHYRSIDEELSPHIRDRSLLLSLLSERD